MSKIGVIGGSGLYNIEGIEIKDRLEINTPFGSPSGEFVVGNLSGKDLVFLPRHGKGHTISPSTINYRANIYGMKKLGVDRVISVSACGSLKEEVKPLDFVIPSQFVDRTSKARKSTFFDDGIVAHIGFSDPVCGYLAECLVNSAKKLKQGIHIGGTYLNMEGPQFSTLAESNLYRSWGMDIIGMTNMPEARLAREAEMCYATLAAVTDYDCWRESGEPVTVDIIVENLRKNVENAKTILGDAIGKLDEKRPCACHEALKFAIITDPKSISDDVKKRLDIIIGKYVK
jgi:5'-methylthioadenosine phosphorylase